MILSASSCVSAMQPSRKRAHLMALSGWPAARAASL